MRLLGYIVLLGGLFYAFVLYAKSRIKIGVSLAKLDIGKLIGVINTGGNIGGKAILKTDLEIKVENGNTFTIRASDLSVQIFHQGTLIAQSAGKSSEKIIVLPKYEAEFIHTLDVVLSDEFFSVIKALKSGQPLVLQYIVRIKLFGIPIKYKDNFTYTK